MRVMERRRLTALTIALAGWLLCVAEGFTLRGRVTAAPEGEPLERVTVAVRPGNAAAMTRSDGTYSLSCAAADTLTVTISCVGYTRQVRRLVGARGELTLNARMEPQERVLEEVKVTELRKRTGAMERLDARGYRKRAVDPSGGSVESMLSTLPGVTGAGELSNSYSVRGGSYDENAVRLNGFEIHRPRIISSQAQEGLSVINPDMAGAVEFSAGGYGAQYTDKLSSVLDVTYRKVEGTEGALKLSLLGAEGAFGNTTGRVSELYGVRYRRTASLLATTDTKGEYDPDFLDWQSNLVWSVSKRLRVCVLTNVALNNYRMTPSDRTTNFGTLEDAKRFKVYFDGRERDRFLSIIGGLSVDWSASRNTTLTLQVSAQGGEETVGYDVSGEYWLDQAGGDDGEGAIGGELGVGRYHEHARNKLKSRILDATLRGITAAGDHHITYGAGIKSLWMDEKVSEWERRDSAGYSIPSTGGELLVRESVHGAERLGTVRISGYVQDNLKLSVGSGLLNLTAGLRVCHTGFNGETTFSPRVSAGYVPARAPQWALRFAAGLYNQAPFFREIERRVAVSPTESVIELNRDIKSQQCIQVIAGSDFTFRAFGRPFRLSAEAYWKHLSRLIPYTIDNLLTVYSGVNGGSGNILGLDARLFGEFVPGSDSWISASVMRGRQKLGGISSPLPSERRYSLSLFFTDYFPRCERIKVSLRGVLADGLPVSVAGGEGHFRTPPYKRVDIGAGFNLLGRPLQWLKSAWLGVDCFNLFDISNVGNYYWVTDVNDVSYAVPNGLTRRTVNVSLSLTF